MKKRILLILILLLSGGFLADSFSVQASEAFIGSQAGITKNLTEAEKVTHLINYIRTLNGAVFIRNGKEFSPADAADHLSSKWQKHKKKVKTARGFVDRLATESKTHEPYQIRFSDGRTVKCGDLLGEELRRIEK